MRIQINLPDGLKVSSFEVNLLLAAKLFDEGLITSGRGAKWLGCQSKPSSRYWVSTPGKYLTNMGFDNIVPSNSAEDYLENGTLM